MAKAPTITAGASSSNDSYSTTEDQVAGTTLFLNVLGNDPKKAGLYSLDNRDVIDLAIQDPIAIPEQSRLGAAISLTASGQIAYSLNSTIAQSLALGETMVDTFLYAIKLANGSLVWQTVTVTVTGTNDAPIAHADLATVSEDVIATGSVATNDADVDHGAVLRFATTGEIPAGFVMATDGSWVLDATGGNYQSLGAGERQLVTISYVVTDEHGATSNASLTLTLLGTNDSPQVTEFAYGSARDSDGPVTLNGLANATDADLGAVLSIVDVPAAADLPPGVSYDPRTSSFTLDHAPYGYLAVGETAWVEVVYAISDGSASTPSSVRWSVAGTNGSPVAEASAATASEDQLTFGQAIAIDLDHGAQLSFATDGYPGFSMASDGQWTFDAAHPDYQALADGEILAFTVPYTVADEFGATATASIHFTLTGRNDAPIVSASVAGSAVEGGSAVELYALANASDPDLNTNLSIVDVPSADELPAGVTFDPLTGMFALDPSHSAYDQLGLNEHAIVTVNYGVSDGLSTTPASVSWTVIGTNDIPIASPTFGAIAEDQILSGQLSATDADNGANLRYTLLGLAPPGFALNGDGSWTFDATGPNYQPAPQGYSGDWTIRYRVTDEHGDGSESFLRVTLNGTNDAPITFPAGAYVTEGSTVTGQLVAYDRDDGAQLAFRLLDAPLPGFALNASGAWSLDASNPAYAELAAGQTAILWVNYVVTDEFGAQRQDVLGLEFSGINSAPIRVGPATTFADGLEDTPFTVTQQQLLAGWGDPERAALTAINLTAAGAAVSANGDGSFTITPGLNYAGGVTLSYAVSDGSLTSAATGNLRFLPVNDPAVIAGSVVGSVTEATLSNPGMPDASGVLTISDPDSPALFVAINGAATARGYGTVSLTQQGSWQYVLNNANPAVNALATGQSLIDSFTATSSDGTSRSVNVTINGVTDTPQEPSNFWGIGDSNDFSGAIANGTPTVEVWDTTANDTLIGTDSDQRFYSLYGTDTIYAQGGNDRINGLSGGGGTFYGQAGDDFITSSGSGPTTSYGGTGDDEVRGGSGSDVLYGGSGIDDLLGFEGNDVLVGGFHIDNLRGGAGADTFRFIDLRDTGDHVLDFVYGTDLLDFAALDANQQLAGDQSFGWSGLVPTAYSLWMQTVSGRIDVYADTDGNPLTAEFMIRLYNSSFPTDYSDTSQTPVGFIF